ncbi:MAG: aconitase X catalytic domain-containing protein [Burkholderiales bacterium]|nr:aconitase X catalytic domain-containing protein [Burkholderiales bacterium]
MRLTDQEKAMADGRDGPGIQKAMDLLLRYGEALGAERLVETRNVCSMFTASMPFQRDYAIRQGSMDAMLSEFNLDSQETVEIPPFRAFTSQLQIGFDSAHAPSLGVGEEMMRFYRRSEVHMAGLGAQLMNTCTPYQVGNVPTRGEHCAWMESSAVIYCNSVLGARTNTEGRESTSAAALTARIPYWGYHLDENRYATDVIELDVDVDSTEDWGILGYYVGEQVLERVPALTRRHGTIRTPNLARLKHFGAAASSSGGVEMYHIVGVTPEALTLEQALGRRAPQRTFRYGEAERRATYERINSTAGSHDIQFVMLGCPHYTIEQIWEAAMLLQGRKVHDNCALWIFTPRTIKALADLNGYTRIIEDAGGVLMSDTCSAVSRMIPPGTRAVALDSAKQAHYLPAAVGVQAWFGSTAQCIDAACTGQWRGALQ